MVDLFSGASRSRLLETEMEFMTSSMSSITIDNGCSVDNELHRIYDVPTVVIILPELELSVLWSNLPKTAKFCASEFFSGRSIVRL